MMNKMVTNGLTDNWNVLNVWGNRANGNGVYLAFNNSLKRNELIEVYSDGYCTNFITVYDDGTFSTDTGVTNKTLRSNIERAIRYAKKNNIKL